MSLHDPNPDSLGDNNANNSLRWYDQDPALKRVMTQLEEATDKYQAQVALNIIKIVLEHHLEEAAEKNGNGRHPSTVEDVLNWHDTERPYPLKRRWYDMNATLSAAMDTLADCPDELQHVLIPQIVVMVENTLQQR